VKFANLLLIHRFIDYFANWPKIIASFINYSVDSVLATLAQWALLALFGDFLALSSAGEFF